MIYGGWQRLTATQVGTADNRQLEDKCSVYIMPKVYRNVLHRCWLTTLVVLSQICELLVTHSCYGCLLIVDEFMGPARLEGFRMQMRFNSYFHKSLTCPEYSEHTDNVFLYLTSFLILWSIFASKKMINS